MATIRIERALAVAVPETAVLFAGAAEVDVTPPIGFPMAGYSTTGQTARGVCGRLFARALVLSGERSERVAFCFVDLMSASRYVLERAAQQTAPRCGIGVDRLVVAATHTHTAPGWFHANTLYDQFAQNEAGFDRGLSDWLASRVATAVVEASSRLRPARLAVVREPLWGIARNRSLPAFLRDPEAPGWNAAGSPGEGAPAGLHPDQRAIDPRLVVLSVFDAGDGAPLAAFAMFGCHSTTRGPRWPYYDPDWPGFAQRTARFEIERSFAGSRPVVAVAGSTSGDTNALLHAVPPDVGPDFSLASHAGVAVGETIARAVGHGAPSARSVPIRVRYAEPSVRDREVDGDPETRLAQKWCFGAPTLAGSEEGRTGFHPVFAREGMTASWWFPGSDPQHPKAPALGPAQLLLATLLDLSPCDVHPLHLVRLGEHVIATVPGEPTSVGGWRIERALTSLPGVASASVLGYAGAYGGYYTTPEEFRAQHYEGSSMLLGRFAAEHLRARLVGLASGSASPTTAFADFETGPLRNRFRDGDECGPVAPSPTVQRTGRDVAVTWQMSARSRVAFSTGPWVSLEASPAGGPWAPLVHLGVPYDDVGFPIVVERIPFGGPAPLAPSDPAPGATETWGAGLALPLAVGAPQRFRVVVGPRDRFPGFAVEVP